LVHDYFTMEIIKYCYLCSSEIECRRMSHQPILSKSHILKVSLWASLNTYQRLHHFRIGRQSANIWNDILHIYFISCHSHICLRHTICINSLQRAFAIFLVNLPFKEISWRTYNVNKSFPGRNIILIVNIHLEEVEIEVYVIGCSIPTNSLSVYCMNSKIYLIITGDSRRGKRGIGKKVISIKRISILVLAFKLQNSSCSLTTAYVLIKIVLLEVITSAKSVAW